MPAKFVQFLRFPALWLRPFFCDYFAQKTSGCMGTGRSACVFTGSVKIAVSLEITAIRCKQRTPEISLWSVDWTARTQLLWLRLRLVSRRRTAYMTFQRLWLRCQLVIDGIGHHGGWKDSRILALNPGSHCKCCNLMIVCFTSVTDVATFSLRIPIAA